MQWIVLVIGGVEIVLIACVLYLYHKICKTLAGMLEYHCDFAGSHERLQLWVKGINKDMNTIAAAISRDREQLSEHDLRVEGLVVRANEIMDIIVTQQGESKSEIKNPHAARRDGT